LTALRGYSTSVISLGLDFLTGFSLSYLFTR
jgi:hypothetical protein